MNADEIFRRLSLEIDAIQAGCGPKVVIEEAGIGCYSIRWDRQQCDEFIKRKEKEYENNPGC